MPFKRYSLHRRSVPGLLAAILLAVALAACGGDDPQDTSPTATPAPPTQDSITIPEGATPAPDPEVTPMPTAAPTELDSAGLRARAEDQARGDLAAYLSASVVDITALDNVASERMNDPQACPLPGELVTAVVEGGADEGELSEEELAALEAAAEADQSPLDPDAVDPGFAIESSGEEGADASDLPEIEPVEYLYLQHAQVIYPYQYYLWPPTGDLIVERCADEALDQEALFVPTANPRGAIADLVRDALRAQGIDPSSGTINTVQAMVWNDSNLGCPVYTAEQRNALAPAMIEGFLVIIEQGGKTYEYHTDTSGEQIIYCAPPPSFNTPEEFITALEAQELVEVVIVEDETATYNGLDREGPRILLTYRGFPVGLVGYDSEDAARQAAQAVDDPAAAYIFVSGQVLIVLEEDGLEAISILSALAEQVRAPLQEATTLEDEVEFDAEGNPLDPASTPEANDN